MAVIFGGGCSGDLGAANQAARDAPARVGCSARALASADEKVEGSDQVARQRNRIEVRRFIASKWLSSQYGDKIAVEIEARPDLGVAMAKANARLDRLRRDQDLQKLGVSLPPGVIQETFWAQHLASKPYSNPIFGDVKITPLPLTFLAPAAFADGDDTPTE